MKKFVLLLFTIPLLSFSLHKYYVALTEISYNTKSKSVEIIANIFVDDFEASLNKDFDIQTKLNTPKQHKEIDSYILKYLEKNLIISINNQQKKYEFIGKEYEADVIFVYLEIKDINSFKTIEIKNSMLIKYFTEQQNLVKVKVNNNRKSLFLTKENYKGLLKF